MICSNVLGGCSGSTGPKQKKNNEDIIYGGSFPSITIKDMVGAQVKLIDALKIDKLFSVVGGSMGQCKPYNGQLISQIEFKLLCT